MPEYRGSSVLDVKYCAVFAATPLKYTHGTRLFTVYAGYVPTLPVAAKSPFDGEIVPDVMRLSHVYVVGL